MRLPSPGEKLSVCKRERACVFVYVCVEEGVQCSCSCDSGKPEDSMEGVSCKGERERERGESERGGGA